MKKTKPAQNEDLKNEPIAVIGMAGIFPKAPDAAAFWRNIMNGVNAIGDPLPAWDAQWNMDAGRIYTSQGGYLNDLYRFNPKEFGIMPASVDGGEPDQLLALQVAKRALADAGDRYVADEFDHTDTGIVLGHSTYFHRAQITGAQHEICVDQTIEILQTVLPSMNEGQKKEVRALLKKQLPQFNADVCPGHVPNVMTGRIANRLNLSGPNYLIDAACASSLLSVEAAIGELRSGNSRMMLAGGVNASLPAQVLVIFSMLNALSRRGKVRPFDVDNDGTLLGEGLGIVVLKRLSDALADGDRVYAVVHGVGQSSDGKGFGLLAPSEKGEILAMRRAYEATGIDPASIDLIEAHGTGIPLGDKTEISALRTIFGERRGAAGSIAVGSVKSMISHCIPAAGMASFIKMCCALYHRTLPPTLCDTVNPVLEIEKTALYVNNAVKPWISRPGRPRRAGINSFGFGGVNAHAILEEAPALAKKPLRCSPWPAELFVFAARDAQDMEAQLSRAQVFAKARDDIPLSDIAYTLCREAAEKESALRLAIVAESAADLAAKIGQALKKVADGKFSTGKGAIVYGDAPVEGKLAFLFPGEGSQYIGMFSDLAVHFDAARSWFDLWDGIFGDEKIDGLRRTDIVFPANSELTAEKKESLEKLIHRMDVGSEAVFIAGQAMHDLLTGLGVAPDVMLGHSSGESSALVASRAVPWENHAELSEFIRKLNRVYQDLERKGAIETGALMAVGLIGRDEIEAAVNGTDILIAMENCPTQTIVYGAKDSIEALSKALVEKGAICEILPFDRGYHTPAFMPMKEVFDRYYEDIGLGAPRVPLYSCATAAAFPSGKKEIRALASAQWVQTVRFVDAVNALYDDGVRVFVEVGPGGKLTSFTDQILRARGVQKECLILASNLEAQSGMGQLLNLMARLYVSGKARADGLFTGRAVREIDLDKTEKEKPSGMFLDNSIPRLKATPELTQALRAIAAQDMPAAQDAEQDISSYLSFFTQIEEKSARFFRGFVYLNVAEDMFLRDHILSAPVSAHDDSLSGLSCVPLMATLEIMAQACAALAGRIDARLIEDVRAYDWIALDEGIATLSVTAAAQEDGRYYAEVFNEDGLAASAYFTFGDYAPAPAAAFRALDDVQENRWPADYQVYDEGGMFHGPLFQVLPNYAASAEGIDALCAPLSLTGFFRDHEKPPMILNPVLFDGHNQLTAFWEIQRIGSDFASFPSRIGRIELYGRCPQSAEGLAIRARRSGVAAAENPLWDFECVDETGHAVLRMENMQSVFFDVPPVFYQCCRDPLNGWIGGLAGEAEDASHVSWRADALPYEFCAVSKSIFLRMLAHCMLNARERAVWNGLKMASVDERTRWLFSMIAVKEAVRYWLYRQSGHLLYPTDIEVDLSDPGYPAAYGWWCEEEYGIVPSAPVLSMVLDGGSVYVTAQEAQADYGFYGQESGV